MLVITKKQIYKFSGVLIVLVALICTLIIAKPSGSILTAALKSDWGLSYRTEGKTPIGNAGADYLKQFNSYYVGNENEKSIYLTFDCGYEAGYTNNILDVLKKHNVKAAFFVVGNYLNDSEDIVKRMTTEGHIVGNHTYTHPNMAAISNEKSFCDELEKSEKKYKEITGKDMPKFYRPPQGKFSESNLKMADKLGYKTIFWSLAYVDWYKDKQPSRDEAFSKLIPRIHPGCIVLLHNTSETNSKILDELLTKWEKMGYTFKNLNELQ